MSMDEMHRRVAEALQTKAQNATTKSLNMRPRMASPGIPATSTDEIAMFVIEANTEARVTLENLKLVTDIYRQIVQPQQTLAEELDPKKPKRMYG